MENTIQKREMNSGDIGKIMNFKIVWEREKLSKRKQIPMISIGMVFTTQDGVEIDGLFFHNLISSSARWRIEDFTRKLDKDIFVEWDGDMWRGFSPDGTFKGAQGRCTIKKDDWGYKPDQFLDQEIPEPISVAPKYSDISDDDIPF